MIPNPYESGVLIWYWYEYGIAVAAGIFSLLFLIYVFGSSVGGKKGVTSKIIGSIAFLGTLPMGLERIGVGVSANIDTMWIMNILGISFAVLNVIYHRIIRGSVSTPVTDSVAEPTSGKTNTDSGSEGATIVDSGSEGATIVDSGSEGATIVDSGQVASSQPQAFLHFKSGPQAGTSIPITQARTVIGRSTGSDIQIDDPSVSRTHAEINFSDGNFTIVDEQSSSGTIIDGATSSNTVLQPGVEIKFGSSEVVFMQGQSSAPKNPVEPDHDVSVKSDPGQTIIAGPEAEMVMRYLAITDGPSKGTTVQLKVGQTSIGRDNGNDIQVSDASVSREHAVIISNSQESKIIDLGSSTGTSVNGESVGGGKVGPGDVISIGENKMSFVTVDASNENEIAEAGASDATLFMETPSGGVRAVLVVQSGPDAGKSFQVTEGDNLIGRDASANILLSGQAVSRRHAILRKRDTSYAVYDLNSSGGIRINDISVGGTAVSPGQEIKFGKSTAVIMDPSSGS